MPHALAAALLVAAATAPEAALSASPLVTAVRVDAPAAEAAELARYVEIRPGEPLDPRVVRHVVELMYATGSYQDVVVETVEAPGGVEVVFRPVPAPLLARIVVEGDEVVGPDEVRRRTRLRLREPLWPARLDEAARDLALSLVERGWLEGRVTAVARPGPRGVEAAFTIAAGPQVRVSRLSVVGSPGESVAAALRNRARPRPGDVFERARATAATEALRTELQKRGYWRAVVRLDESYDPTAGRMALVFVIDPGPRLRLEVEGPPPARGIADRMRRVLREGEGKVDALEQGTDLLEEELRRRGHRAVTVTRREESRPAGEVAIIYEVEAGPRADVASVRVEGDVTEGLVALVATRPGTPLEERLLAEDARALVRALEDRGHATPKVDAEVPDGGGALPVVFRIAAGPATRLESVEVRSPEPLPADSAPQELWLRAGGPYRVRDLARDRDTVLAAYRTAGHLAAAVTPEVAFSADGTSARVVLQVRPGPATRVDHVVIAGLDRTKEAVVRRELEIREGEPLAVQRILETQRRLGSLGLFQRVSVAEMDPESRDTRSVVVRVEEGPRTTVSYGVGYGEREKLRGSVEVTRRNLFGMDRRLSVFARASLQPSFRILATYREPYLLGHRQELFVTGYREDEDRPAFSFTRQGITVQTARPLSSTWSLILRETFEEGRTFNTDEDCLQFSREFCPHTLSGPSASLVHDSRDDPLDPTRGLFVVTDVQLSHRILGGNSLAKGYVQAAGYHLLRVGTVVAVSGRLGLGGTFGPDEPVALPTPDRFFAGGDYTLRGFGTDAVRPVGGNAVLLSGVELRHRVVRALWAAAFAEAGNVYALASNLTLRDLRYTAGLGLRYKSLVGPLRIDWGYKLDPVGDESRHHVHFTVGHAF